MEKIGDDMSLLNAIEKRRAYRALSNRSVDEEVLNRLVRAAHSAPSSGNNQPWRIITTVEKSQLDALKETLVGGNYWGKNAPVIAAFLTHPSYSMTMGMRELAYFELGMAAMNYQLQAVEEGLYAHPIVGFDADKAKEVLKVPEDVVLEILVIVGYPGEMSTLSEKHQQVETSLQVRKPIEEIHSFNQWSEQLVPKKKK
ncbi:MAG: nitroreductase [Spirochaetia bacterium]|nr:nitroreductase [Spirochaetia bacterium]